MAPAEIISESASISVAVFSSGEAIGVREEKGRRGWFTRIVTRYLKKNLARLKAQPVSTEVPIPDQARSRILRAAVVSAAGGAVTGAISTAATIVTAETEGIGGLVAVPIAGAAIGIEMVLRSIVHVNLTCELAHIFQVRFDPDDTDDLFRLYALAFGTHEKKEDEGDFGRGLVEKVTETEGEDVGERIGHMLLGESVMRNVVPFVGIFSSAITNYLVTRKLGDTVRRYMRYQRAMEDAISHAELTCERSRRLLLEGLWFIFTADGKLAPEEAACLAHLLSDLPADERAAITARFTDDEIEWLNRVKDEVPEDMREAFLYALQVAACLDKEVSLPERKILKRVSMMFHLPFEPAKLTKMVDELEENGVLAPEDQPMEADIPG